MSTSRPKLAVQACVFDAYGTLFDVHSAVRRCAGALGPASDLISQTWRNKQLEYAWVSSLSDHHVDFWSCTVAALDYALRVYGADLGQREKLLEAYRSLDAYPDAVSTLQALRGAGIRTILLSNGTPAMLDDALRSAKLADFFERSLSIERVRIYKPAPAAYRLATDDLNLPPSEIGFVSSNAWDVAGARRFGFQPVWVNRFGLPDEYISNDTQLQANSLAEAGACFVAMG